MLPPGHIAAGYLVTRALLALTHPALTPLDQGYLILWGMFFSFAPDIDTFWVFIKMKRFISSDDVDHRKFISHAPILWLIGGLALFFIGWLRHDVFLEYFGIVAWLGSWSHFALDTIQTGVIWLWPWRNEQIALYDPGMKSNIGPQGFIPYWFKAMKFYVTRGTLTFIPELLLIIISFALIFH